MLSFLLIVIIYISFISLGLPDSMFGAAWPSMQENFSVPFSYAGIISVVVSIGTVISSLSYPKVSRRLSTGLITGFSIILTASSCLLFSKVSSFYLLIPFSLVLGLGAGAVDAGLNNYVSLHYKSSVVSLLHAFWGIGTLVGPFTLSLQLRKGNGWRSSYVFIGVIQALIALTVLLTLKLWPKEESVEIKNKEKSVTIKETVKKKGVIFAVLSFFTYLSMEHTSTFWVSTFLVQARSFSASAAAAATGFLFWGITTGRLMSALFSNKAGDRKMIRGAEVIIFISILLLLTLPYRFSAIIFFLLGLGFGPVYPAMIHQTPYIFSVEYSRSVMSLEMAAAYMASLTFSPFFGVLGRKLGMRIFPFVMLILLLLNTYCTFMVHKEKR